MNYLVDRLNFIESEDKKTHLKLSSLMSKKEKPKVKSIAASVNKVSELNTEQSKSNISNTRIDVVTKPLNNIENKKTKAVVWL